MILLSYHTKKGLQNLVESAKTRSERKHIGPVDIKVSNEILATVNRYEHLGSTVTENGDGKIKIRRRLGIDPNKLMSINSLWKGESAETQLKILRACIFTVTTYGWENWTMIKAVSKLIDFLKMNCCRRILWVTWIDHRTNESIRNEFEVKENWHRRYVLIQKLKYFGRLKRHHGAERIILEGRVNGKGNEEGLGDSGRRT